MTIDTDCTLHTPKPHFEIRPKSGYLIGLNLSTKLVWSGRKVQPETRPDGRLTVWLRNLESRPDFYLVALEFTTRKWGF